MIEYILALIVCMATDTGQQCRAMVSTKPMSLEACVNTRREVVSELEAQGFHIPKAICTPEQKDL